MADALKPRISEAASGVSDEVVHIGDACVTPAGVALAGMLDEIAPDVEGKSNCGSWLDGANATPPYHMIWKTVFTISPCLHLP